MQPTTRRYEMNRLEQRHEMQQQGYTKEEINDKLTLDDYLAAVGVAAFIGLLWVFWSITP